MNLKEVKQYVEGLMKDYFKPKVLKKFDEDTNGNLTFDGNPISAKVSGKYDNAIETITDTTTPSNSGLYVKDLSEEVKQINIAQKTVNELGYDELLDAPFNFDANKSSQTGTGVSTTINKNIVLNDSIEKYTYIDIYLKTVSPTRNRVAQCTRLKVDDIKFNNSDTENPSNGSTFTLVYDVDNTSATYSAGAVHQTAKVWFKDNKTMFLHEMIVSVGSDDWKKYSISSIQGIKKEIITIDPVNYIDTNQGIQDTPVGHIVEIMDNKETKHYLQCDGSEKTIGTYPHLEQHFREMGAINMFGGDGITTYKLPNIEPKPFAYVSHIPEMTANNAPAPYVASADSIHSSPYQPYMAFNSKEGDAGYCWHSLSATSHWLQIDYGAPKKINSFKMKGRKSYSQWYGQMPTSFKLQGSNDGTNFVDIKSFSGLSWGSSIEVEFMLDEPVEYRYYKLADMKSSSNFICFNKIEYAYDVKKYTFIKYEPTYFIDTINGYEEITELLDTPIELDTPNKIDLIKIPVAEISGTKYNIEYVTKQLNGQLVQLNDNIDNYDEIEIVAYGLNNTGHEKFDRVTLRIRKEDYITSDSGTFAEGSQDLNFFAVSTGIRFMQLRFNIRNDKRSFGLCQTTYYHGPAIESAPTWDGIRLEKVRGIRHRYTVSSK